MNSTVNEETARLSAEVPLDLHKAARKRAIDEGRPTASLVEDAVRAYLEEVEKNGAPALNGDPDGPSEAQKTA